MRITVKDSDALLLVKVLESGLRLNTAFGKEAFDAVESFSGRIHNELGKFARELEMARLLSERDALPAPEPLSDNPAIRALQEASINRTSES